MHAALIAAAEESTQGVRELPPEAIGLGAFGVLLVLLAATYAFRSVGTRH